MRQRDYAKEYVQRKARELRRAEAALGAAFRSPEIMAKVSEGNALLSLLASERRD